MGQTNLSNLHHILKVDTSDIHQRLHVHPLLTCLNPGSEITLQGYINVLKAFFAYYRGIRLIYGKSMHIASLIEQNLSAIHYDLLHFKEPVSNEWSPKSEHCLISRSEEFGVLYVIKGSTLGAKVIFRHINKELGLNDDTGANFFYMQSKNSDWSSFLRKLEKAQLSEKECTAAAHRTFNLLEDCLNSFMKYAEVAELMK